MTFNASQTPAAGYQRLLMPRDIQTRQGAEHAPLDDSLLQQPTQLRVGQDLRPSKRRRLACRACRQAKSRCEGSDEGKSRCKRCSELSCECVVDTTFKRVNQRNEIRELKDQVEQLRWQANVGQGPQGIADFVKSPISSPSIIHPSPDSSGRAHSLSQAEAPQSNASPRDGGEASHGSSMSSMRGVASSNSLPTYRAICSQSLENVKLEPKEITHLFQLYFEHYHPFFPILKLHKPPEQIHEASPLLFWVIILVAARHDPEDPALIANVIEPVRRLLWAAVATPPHSILSLQAISICCRWHLPASSMSTDISFMLAGILKTSAMHIGVHRPEILQDFSRTKCQLSSQELRDAVMVWSACYLAAESVTTCIGQASYFTTDETIERTAQLHNPYDLPIEFHNLLLIQRFVSRVHLAMDGNDRSDRELTSLTTLLQQDYAMLRRHISMHQSMHTELLLLSAELQLHAIYLFDDNDSESRRLAVLKAYSTALLLISKVETADKASNATYYFPTSLMMTCTLAAILVMKVANSSYHQYVDMQAGKQAFNSIVLISRRCSVQDNDLAGRMSRILAQLWNVHQALAREHQQQPGLRIKSRFICSVVHDSLWLWREKFGGQQNNGAPAIPTAVMSTSDSVMLRDSVGLDPDPLTTSPAAQSPGTIRNSIADPPVLDLPPITNALEATINNESDALIGNFLDFEEDNDWMWNVGFPSVSGMDLGFP